MWLSSPNLDRKPRKSLEGLFPNHPSQNRRICFLEFVDIHVKVNFRKFEAIPGTLGWVISIGNKEFDQITPSFFLWLLSPAPCIAALYYSFSKNLFIYCGNRAHIFFFFSWSWLWMVAFLSLCRVFIFAVFRLSMLANTAHFLLPFVLDGGNVSWAQHVKIWCMDMLYLHFSYFAVKNTNFDKWLGIYV